MTYPMMLCDHCGRCERSALDAHSTHCNAPFDRKPHSFTKPHPYLTIGEAAFREIAMVKRERGNA